MRPDIRYITYSSSELNEEGNYDDDSYRDGDNSFDGYVCPECSADQNDMKFIEFPSTKTAKALLDLWTKVRKEEDDNPDQSKMEYHQCHYGIPLQNEELKLLMLDALI
jgi:hypothetical protein